MRQNVPHDPAAKRCYCWSCANARLLAEHQLARERARAEARELTMDLVVSVVNEVDRQIVYKFEIGEYWVTGKLAELLNLDYGDLQFLVSAFQSLEGAQRLDALAAARRKHHVRVATLWPAWDEEFDAQQKKGEPR